MRVGERVKTRLEGEEQLVHLEEGAAGAAVDEEGVVLVETLDALLQVVGARRLVKGDDEEGDVGIEAELVHGVDPREVREQEVEDRGAVGTRPVALACGVDLLLSLLGDLQLVGHLDRGGLGAG